MKRNLGLSLALLLLAGCAQNQPRTEAAPHKRISIDELMNAADASIVIVSQQEAEKSGLVDHILLSGENQFSLDLLVFENAEQARLRFNQYLKDQHPSARGGRVEVLDKNEQKAFIYRLEDNAVIGVCQSPASDLSGSRELEAKLTQHLQAD